jgi:Outer membrane protein beta-barrel domain
MKTVKNFLVLALFSCATMVTSAQGTRLYAGLKAGFGVPHLSAGSTSTPLSEGYSSRLGFYSGIVTEYQSGGRFGLRAEINYSSQGGIRTGMQALPLPSEMLPLWQQLPNFGIKTTPYMYANIKSDAILNYLEIPVMGKLTFNMSPRLNVYVQAGPYMGVRIHAKNITSGSSSIFVDKDGDLPVDAILILAEQPTMGAVSFDNSENITSDVHRFNIGAQGAVGFGLMIGSGKVFIEAGGNYGFIPVQIDKANGSNNTGAGTLTFGYMFEI